MERLNETQLKDINNPNLELKFPDFPRAMFKTLPSLLHGTRKKGVLTHARFSFIVTPNCSFLDYKVQGTVILMEECI